MKKFKAIHDYYQILTLKIVDKMKESLEYKTPWMVCEDPPFNPVTGTHYKGINFIALMSKDFNDPRFYTYNNIQGLAKENDLNIHVNTGASGTSIFKAVKQGIFKENENEEKEQVGAFWRSVYAGTVFNASQITGLEPYLKKEISEFEVHDNAEKLIQAMCSSGLKIEHMEVREPHYSQSNDTIVIPLKENFKTSQEYYGTLISLMAKSTKHESRLKREFNETDVKKQNFEQLVGELSSYFMGARIGLKYAPDVDENRAACLKSWIGDLQDDKMLIFKAASKANGAVDYMLSIKAKYFNEPDEVVEEVTQKKLKI